MFSTLFFRLIPYLFLTFFIFFEFSPAYFAEKEVIKPYFTFIVLYALINNDSERFRPLMILLFGLFYDFLDGAIVGITSLFFLITLHLLRRKHSTIVSVDFKIIWINFIFILFLYVSVSQITKVVFHEVNFEFKRILLSLIISIILFPIFNSLIEKFNTKFKIFNE